MISTSERRKILSDLEACEYGTVPPAPLSVTGEVLSAEANFAAGKATLETVRLTVKTENGDVIFPFSFCHRNGAAPSRTVLLLNFRPAVPDRYLPAEELLDLGWNFASLYYEEVTKDSPEIDRNAGILRKGLSPAPGKIALWAWAGMRILDYLLTRSECDPRKIGVVGHSRLGKTALLAGAYDERFAFVHSNCSGTAGAADFSMIGEGSESVEAITRNFPYWFCDAFRDLVGKEKEMPVSQSSLCSLIAPRFLSVTSAEKDLWATPIGEFRAAKTAGGAWEAYGKPGLISPDRPNVGEVYGDGSVLYTCRPGTHYFSRDDWHTLLAFLDSKPELSQ